MSEPFFLILQLSDSGFPAGGFTHSGGLEAAVRYGDVDDAEGLRRLMRSIVCQAGYGGLPVVRAAYADWRELPALDAMTDLFLNQPVSNRASRAQGLAFVRTSARIFTEPAIDRIVEDIDAKHLCAHYAPIFGAVLGTLSIDVETVSRLYLYQSARAVVLSGVKLGVVGMFDGQRLLGEIAPDIDRTLTCCRHIAAEDIAQTAPILDLYQSTHDRLYSRLFQS